MADPFPAPTRVFVVLVLTAVNASDLRSMRSGKRRGRSMDVSLDGWSIESFDEVEWGPWGGAGNARAKVIGSADGYIVTFVEAEPGYRGDPHEHAHPEFFHLIEGTVRNQGVLMNAGDGYAAAAGSTHTDFATDTGAKYIIIFKL